ncbi:MAG TPA: CHAT domain-containing protein, partial [Kofleriaceae bacterium]
AIASIERQRADVGLDSLKPWIVDHVWRRPFDDLFVTYVEQGRLRDAFGVVQRATARSLLDGLVEASARASNGTHVDLARTGDRLAGLKAVARSVRASAAANPPQTSELLPALGGRHVLTYFSARDQLWLAITTSNGEVTILSLGDSDELAKLAAKTLEVPDDGKLGKRLVPATALPAAGVPIYVALDQSMHHVAFSALRVGDDYLVKRHPIALIPNAAVLARLVALPRRTGRRIVLGDPAGDLAGAKREAVEVATSLGVEANLGTRATRASVLSAGSLQVLHVASHARMTELGPVLVLADGDLPGGEIIDRGIAADVVILTSCASADPLDRDELGPLAAAFLAAGSRTVVASRWSVDDALAREFARLFYRANGVNDPIRATATAQTTLIERGVPASRWASFVVLGAGAATTSKGARP